MNKILFDTDIGSDIDEAVALGFAADSEVPSLLRRWPHYVAAASAAPPSS